MGEYRSGPLTEEQKAIAQPILDHWAGSLCLMSGMYKDQEVAFICQVETEGESYNITPRMIVVTADMFDDCKDSAGAPPNELETIDV